MRVGVVAGAVLVGEALGLDLEVVGERRLEAGAAHVEPLEHVEHLQRGDALGVGAERVDVDAAIVGRLRLDPFGMVGGEVGAGQPAADALEIALDRVGDWPVVERVAAALGDHPVGAGEVGIAERSRRSAGPLPQRSNDIGGLLDPGAGAEEGRAGWRGCSRR